MDAAAKRDKPKEIDAAIFVAPLDGSLNIEAGTMEVVFSLGYSFDDYLRPETSSCTPFTFLQIYNKDGSVARKNKQAIMGVYAVQVRGLHRLSFETNYYYWELKGPPLLRSGGTSISSAKERGTWILEGEWHSLVVTWKVENDGLHAEMFLDGKLQISKIFPLKESATGPFAKDDLIGIGGLEMSSGSILYYRLSNKVRTKEEIASKDPLKPDEATTFFLDGELAAKCGKKDLKDFKIMSKKGEIVTKENGSFFGNFKIVKSPKGKVIQFYDKPKL
jgi:hypothetical protein